MREEVKRGWWDASLVHRLEALIHCTGLPVTVRKEQR